MKTINLTQGKVALVDDEDYDFLMQWKWFVHKCGKNYYAERQDKMINGKQKTIKMHRVIINAIDGKEVDHKDRNTLNNQKYNLRNCTHGQNQLNKETWGNSKFRGVNITPVKKKGKIYSRIQAMMSIKGKTTYLGCFKTEEDAAHVYDEAAKKIYGEFANLNFKE